jgi:hypothetical protein
LSNIYRLTSPRGMSGGPAAMSAAFVPGCILLLALASRTLCSMTGSWLEKLLPSAGDLGPIWISVGGGGLGSLGELGGKDISMANGGKPGLPESVYLKVMETRDREVGGAAIYAAEKLALKTARFLTRLRCLLRVLRIP